MKVGEGATKSIKSHVVLKDPQPSFKSEDPGYDSLSKSSKSFRRKTCVLVSSKTNESLRGTSSSGCQSRGLRLSLLSIVGLKLSLLLIAGLRFSLLPIVGLRL